MPSAGDVGASIENGFVNNFVLTSVLQLNVIYNKLCVCLRSVKNVAADSESSLPFEDLRTAIREVLSC